MGTIRSAPPDPASLPFLDLVLLLRPLAADGIDEEADSRLVAPAPQPLVDAADLRAIGVLQGEEAFLPYPKLCLGDLQPPVAPQ